MERVVEYEDTWGDFRRGSAPIQGASWWLAERIVKGCDSVQIMWSPEPEGGGYDVLHLDILHKGKQATVLLNRNGSIHAHSEVRSVRMVGPGVWDLLLTPDGRQQVLADLFDGVVITPHSGRPSTSQSLTCRVISQVMFQAVPLPELWRSWGQWAPTGPNRTPASLLEGQDGQRLATWVVSRDGTPVAKFSDGWMQLLSGERVDLYGSYRAGQSPTVLAARVHTQSPTRRQFPAGVPDFP